MKEWVAIVIASLVVTMPVSALAIDAGSVQAVSVTSSGATIEWTTDIPADGKVEFGTNINSLVTVPETGGMRTSHQVTLTGLSSGQRYYYRVISSDGSVPASSNYFDFSTMLAKVSGLSIESLAHDQVKLKWNVLSGAAKYAVYKDSVKVADSHSAQYTALGLIPEKTYLFSVAGIDAYSKEGERSDALSVNTAEKPVNISFVQASEITKSKAKITWKTNIPADSMVSYGKTASYGLVKTESGMVTDHEIVLDSLDPGTRYYFKVSSKGKESQGYDFQTVGGDQALVISDVQASQITKTEARIKWTASIPAPGEVRYSLDDSFDSRKASPAVSAAHDVLLDGLLSGATYYYKVVSEGVESGIRSFTTESSQEDFLSLAQVPSVTNSRQLNISGTTRAGRLYIFINENRVAQVKEQLDGASFSYTVNLDPTAYYNGTLGLNYLQVMTWDAQGNKDQEELFIYVDMSPPPLNVGNIPAMTNKDRLNISGFTEKGAVVEFFINSQSQGRADVNLSGYFQKTVNLGTQTSNLTIAAKDIAGNHNSQSWIITIDRTAPQIEWLVDMRGKTHFKLFRIRGKTEPFATVRAINFGPYTGCDDPKIKSEWIDCDKYYSRTGTEPGDQITGVADPLSWGIGQEYQEKADSDGVFEMLLSLVPGEGNKDGENRFKFVVTDLAGNTNKNIEMTIMYSPGCPDWVIGNVESYPFNLYTRDMAAGDILASAFFPISYIGSGVPVVKEVWVRKDDTNRGLLQSQATAANKLPGYMSQLTDANKLIRIEKPKASKYDDAKKQLFVYSPIRIGRYTGSAQSLPPKLSAFLAVQITYTVDGSTQSCSVYPAIQFDIQKPEQLTKWLSPTMINNTIKMLDNAINITTELVKILRTASMVGLIACGAMVAYHYISSFFQSETEMQRSGQVCSQKEEDMKNVYYVCDRILCPDVPPDCKGFEAIDSEKGYTIVGNPQATPEDVAKQREINQEWFYLHQKAVQDQAYKGNLEKYISENTGKSGMPGEYKAIQGGPTAYHTEIQTAIGDKSQTKYVRVDLIPVDQAGKFDQAKIPEIYSIHQALDMNNKNSPNPRTQFISKLQSEANKCRGQTIVVMSEIPEYQSSGSLSIVTPTAQRMPATYDMYCEKMSAGDIGTPNIKGVGGCFNENCPQFDDTKCPLPTPRGDIIPTEDIASSARCQCLPGLMSHFNNWLKVMVGAKKCLQQAMIGEVRGGFCERLLAQFVCDFLIMGLRTALKFLDSPSSEGGAGTVRGAVRNYQTGSQQISNQLSKRYGGIAQQRFCLSSDQLINKACVFGITGDWSILDGMLGDFVDAVEVEPIATVNAESRPYSYDPFTGRMNIGYNVYVGFVPGDQSQVKVWLECDRNAPDGNFCGTQAEQKDVRLPRYSFSKNDPPINENIGISDNNAKYWYNVAVMQINYKLAGKDRKKEIRTQIWRKGDLAYGCYFSPLNGIECNPSEWLTEAGIAQLYSLGKGSFISPNSNVYYPGQTVAAVLKIENRYEGPFYVRLDYSSGKQPVEYSIPGLGTEPGKGTEQYFNIMLDHVQDSTTNAVTESALGASVYTPWTGTLSPINDRLTLISATGGSFQISYYDRNGDRTARVVTLSLGPGEQKEQILEYSQPVITSITYLGSGQTQQTTPQLTVTYADRLTGQSRTFNTYFERKTIPTGSIGSRTVKVSLMEDTNSDGHGDTPILYNAREPQGFSYSYSISQQPTNANILPLIDLVEPVGTYFNNDGQSVPIGVNVWSAYGIRNLEIEVSLRGIGSAASITRSAKYRIGSSDTTPITGPECIKYDGQRSWSEGIGGPPFIGFFLDLQSCGLILTGDAMYDVTVVAKTLKTGYESVGGSDEQITIPGLTGKPVTRRFKFDQSEGDSQLRQQQVMICLGSNCAGQPFSQGMPIEALPLSYMEKFNMSEIPTTRGG